MDQINLDNNLEIVFKIKNSDNVIDNLNNTIFLKLSNLVNMDNDNIDINEDYYEKELSDLITLLNMKHIKYNCTFCTYNNSINMSLNTSFMKGEE